jgi:hypothetical protein
MPVNMNPDKRRNKPQSSGETSDQTQAASSKKDGKSFGDETEQDREKAMADAEWKNLWDATEVIDMDKW